MKRENEVAVTVSAHLYSRLSAMARRLEVPLEWVVASLLLDGAETGALDLKAVLA